MDNAILNEWVPMQDVVIPDEVNFISVDTRDFNWFMSEELPNPSKAGRFMTSGLPVAWSTTAPEKLFFLINELRIRCKDNKWNFLQTKHGGYWDLKYIWFKREASGEFSVWTRNWGTTLNTTHGLAAIVDWKQNDN
jgi:hypothetical protein